MRGPGIYLTTNCLSKLGHRSHPKFISYTRVSPGTDGNNYRAAHKGDPVPMGDRTWTDAAPVEEPDATGYNNQALEVYRTRSGSNVNLAAREVPPTRGLTIQMPPVSRDCETSPI